MMKTVLILISFLMTQTCIILIDYIPDLGGRAGFQERPWSLDDRFVPTNGLREAPALHHYIPMVDGFDEQVALFEADFPFYRNPVLESAHGDRVSEVRINESGSFNANTAITINHNFDGNHRPDLNLDGQPDFVQASAEVTVTTGLSGFILDENGTFEELHDVNGDKVDDARWRNLFVEEPSVNLVPQIAGIATHQAENESDFFRLNGLIDYNPSFNLSHFDLHVDHRLPHKFFYGLEPSVAENISGMGGSITIMEGLPDGASIPGSKSVYTDQHGFYSLSGLSPGLYNVSVFMEDKNFQESTFRPDANTTHVTQVIYVPGFPKLELITDARGIGVSSLLWDENSKALSVPSRSLSQDIDIYQFTFNDVSYEVIKTAATWANAARDAVSRGGKLVEIESTEEQDAIFAAITNDAGITAANTVAPDGGGGAYLWIGGNDIAVEGNWVWDGDNDLINVSFWTGAFDGTAVENSYENWGSMFGFQMEPDDFFDQDALAISLDGWPLGAAGQWNDVDQSNLLYSIIEYDEEVPPIPHDIRFDIREVSGVAQI